METPQRFHHYPLRMPENLSRELKQAAATNHRSLNAEIVFQLSRIIECAQAGNKEADAQAS